MADIDEDNIREQLAEQRDELLAEMQELRDERREEPGPVNREFDNEADDIEREEVRSTLDQSARRKLDRVEAAIERLEAGEYGTCIECGNEIAAGRLEVEPAATRCIECADRAAHSTEPRGWKLDGEDRSIV